MAGQGRKGHEMWLMFEVGKGQIMQGFAWLGV